MVSYEQRELCLEVLVKLYKVPGFVTELYLNYDWGLYTSNLFDELYKVLRKNAFLVAVVFTTHQLFLKGLTVVRDGIERNCLKRISDRAPQPPPYSPCAPSPGVGEGAVPIPTITTQSSDHIFAKIEGGQGGVQTAPPAPGLSLLADKVWPYTMGYAVVMLNTDQHYAGKKNESMTHAQFINNLRGTDDGGGHHDPVVMGEIHLAIRNDEIVMPAEQTGLVKENYQWKQLLFQDRLLPQSLMEGKTGGKVELYRLALPSEKEDRGLINSLVSFIVASSEVPLELSLEEQELVAKAVATVEECHPEHLLQESKFLLTESLQELVKFLIVCSSLEGEWGEEFRDRGSLFYIQLVTRITITNRDRVGAVWRGLVDHLHRMISASSRTLGG